LELLLVQLLRHLQAQARKDVALPALELRRAAALDPQQLPVLGAAGHLQRHRAVRRRYVDSGPQCRVGERDRHVDDEVGAAPLVDRRLGYARDDMQISGRAAGGPGLALSLEPDPGAVLDAGRNLHRVALRSALAPGSTAARARIFDHGAVPAAAWAGLREREEPLALRDHSAATALGTDLRRRAGLRTRSATLAASRVDLNRDPRLDSLERVLEREVDLDLEIGAALGPRLLGSTASATEDPAEDVAEIPEIADVEVEVARREAATPAGASERVVLLALLRVREHVVGVLDLLEALLGRLVARVSVRVVLAGQLSVSLLDLVGGSALRYAEGAVQILSRGHARSPPAPDGSPGHRAGSPSAAPRLRFPPRSPT